MSCSGLLLFLHWPRFFALAQPILGRNHINARVQAAHSEHDSMTILCPTLAQG